MVNKVHIKNFKSIRDLEFDAKRVNVLIGEPNTGKSNILEALAVFSQGIYEHPDTFRDVLRFKTAADLFFDRELTEVVKVVTDGLEWSLKFESPQFNGTYLASGQNGIGFNINQNGRLQITQFPGLQSPVRYYRFKDSVNLNDPRFGALFPPSGANLVAVLTTNKRLRRLVNDLFAVKGFRLVIDNEKNELAMAKDVEGQLYTFSYATISETLRRIVFFMAALETNENAILLLDEPEANTFPFYTTYVAERIALDETNQFFLSTHNPYVLGSIVAKTQVKDLHVFITTMESYQTKLKLVTKEGLSKILDYGPDAFLNLERIAEE